MQALRLAHVLANAKGKDVAARALEAGPDPADGALGLRTAFPARFAGTVLIGRLASRVAFRGGGGATSPQTPHPIFLIDKPSQ